MRTVQQEINDLAVRLEDSGLKPASAQREAERIAASIVADTRRTVADEIRRTAETDTAYRPKWARGMLDAAHVALEGRDA